MPFLEKVRSREELCRLALSAGANKRELCRRFGISPTTLYKWSGRYSTSGLAGLEERSRRPLHSPMRTSAVVEAEVLGVRDENPAWGGRKIAASLRRQGQSPPSPSTVTEILRRHGEPLVGSQGQRSWKRFEHPAPNLLWQMDFKGHVPLQTAGRLHPLTVVDDHSRFAVVLHAADNERIGTVQEALQGAFERYGLPYAIQTDNGSPWGDTNDQRLTRLGVWLIEHGVDPWHSPPLHPQSNGKNERFNRTLKTELLGRVFRDLAEAQPAFDDWRHRYNHHRPHDALGLAVPADRYTPSPRAFRQVVEPFDYAGDEIERTVDSSARISFKNRRVKISKALIGKRIVLRPTGQDGVFDLVFRHVTVRSIDLTYKLT